MLKQYIIAIGGSEGSIEPLRKFFYRTPLDNASYVVLRHLPKGFQSELNMILQPYSALKVAEARRGASIEKDCIYYAPPTYNLIIEDGTLEFVQREGPLNRAIDVFMESLAQNENQRKAIAVILSGNGADGVKGAAAIKKAGGLVVVQSPESSECADLPRNVIKSGNADFVLLPEDMPIVIQGYANRFNV